MTESSLRRSLRSFGSSEGWPQHTVSSLRRTPIAAIMAGGAVRCVRRVDDEEGTQGPERGCVLYTLAGADKLSAVSGFEQKVLQGFGANRRRRRSGPGAGAGEHARWVSRIPCVQPCALVSAEQQAEVEVSDREVVRTVHLLSRRS
jgi:hypothetical protein